MDYTKKQTEVLLRMLELLCGKAPAQRRSRIATLNSIRELRKTLERQIESKEIELGLAMFQEDRRIRREIRNLKRQHAQTTAMLRLIANSAADSAVASEATIEFL